MTGQWPTLRTLRTASILAGAALLVTVLAAGSDTPLAQQQPNPAVRPPAGAVAPGGPGIADPTKPGNYDAEMWRQVRQNLQGQVSIPDKKAGVLVQSDGENWRNLRNGPLPTYGAWAMAGMVALLAVFFLVRGRIRVEHGWAGRTIERFTGLERMGHWLLALSFIILALTGLNVLYGRYVLLPVIGKETFASLSQLGKLAHNYVAFAFMIGLVWVFATWVLHNLPHWRDVQWIAQGGGILVKGRHPPAWKFNFGQKVIFWLVILGGVSISMSGLALMFPFQTALFAKTFGLINMLGFNLPIELSPVQEMQYATTWHGIVALFLVVVIIAHIYIGTIGMQGAFSAMGSGQVDVNWAKEHHSLWADRVLRAEGGREGADHQQRAKPQPAE